MFDKLKAAVDDVRAAVLRLTKGQSRKSAKEEEAINNKLLGVNNACSEAVYNCKHLIDPSYSNGSGGENLLW